MMRFSVYEVVRMYTVLTHISYTTTPNRLRYMKWISHSSGSTNERKGRVVDEVRTAYFRLGLDIDCKLDDIKAAYIKLAQKYHPDSSSSEANTEKFIEIQDAYKKCTIYARNAEETRQILEALDEELDEINSNLDILKHRQVAHRQYLSFDVGPGTYSQRERYHRQLRLDRALDSVYDKKLEKSMTNTEDKVVGTYTGKQPQHTPRITQTLERLAEDLIREGMAKGEFSSLPGEGKPLKSSPSNPVIDFTAQKLNEVLINSGLTPDWILLDKEIRADIHQLKKKLFKGWVDLGAKPLTYRDHCKWFDILEKNCLPDLKSINIKINDYNLLVPAMSRQRLQVSLDQLFKNSIEENIEQYSSEDDDSIVSLKNNTVTPTGYEFITNILKFLYFKIKGYFS